MRLSAPLRIAISVLLVACLVAPASAFAYTNSDVLKHQQAAEERPQPKAILVVTDGETGWPSAPVAPRVVAAVTRKPRYCGMPPEWMDVVILNPEE